MFRAILLSRINDQFSAGVAELEDSDLPVIATRAVKLSVEYSSLNYKDALALTNRSPVVRKWPMVPGIDAVGTVTESSHPGFSVGTTAVLNGWGAGEIHWGGLAQRACLDGDWLVPLPEGLTSLEAMAIGTAGYTAMLCVLALEDNGVNPGVGEILVTGASGGVGSIAILLLARLGYRVVASTGKSETHAYLKELGAQEIIDRATLAAPGKPLQKERFAGVVDSVGSHTLANACAQVRYAGVVTACGLAQGMDFPASVAPFILRGVKLIGVDSVMAPIARRVSAWQRLARDIDHRCLASLTQKIGLGESFGAAAALMAGTHHGRTVIDVNA